MPLEIAPADTPRTFRLSGELDLLNAEQVASELEPATKEPGDIVLDLSNLEFIDSSGIRTLLRTADALGGRGRLILRAPTRQVHAVLSLVGVAIDGSPVVIEGEREPDWGTPISRTFAADGPSLSEIRAFVRGRAIDDSFARWADSIVLAVSEASANAIVHSGSPEVHVVWRPFADHAEVEVIDTGVFTGKAHSRPIGGGNRGFLLMMALMDQVSITCGTEMRPGTVVRMTKSRNGRPSRPRDGRDSRNPDKQFPSPEPRVAS